MARKTIPWDAADSLETREDIAAYLDAVLADGDPDFLKAALGDIARAKGMTEIAQAAGLGRASFTRHGRPMETRIREHCPSPESARSSALGLRRSVFGSRLRRNLVGLMPRGLSVPRHRRSGDPKI
jgi:probable addiction module antidote protein